MVEEELLVAGVEETGMLTAVVEVPVGAVIVLLELGSRAVTSEMVGRGGGGLSATGGARKLERWSWQ